MRYPCPACSTPITPRALRSRWLARPHVVPCGGCGAFLQWRARPWRRIRLGMLFAAPGLVLAGVLCTVALRAGRDLEGPLAWAALLAMTTGAALMLWGLAQLSIERAPLPADDPRAG